MSDCMCCDLLLEPICRPNMLYDLPRSLHSKQFLTAHVQTYRSSLLGINMIKGVSRVNIECLKYI